MTRLHTELVMLDFHSDTSMAAVGNKLTITGILGGFFSWIASVDFVGLCSIVIGIAGLAITYHFKRREDARKNRVAEADERRKQADDHRRQEEHEARMLAIRERCDL
jgi:5-bromo-4-chloroindolyl phosphate hydrolysis protein